MTAESDHVPARTIEDVTAALAGILASGQTPGWRRAAGLWQLSALEAQYQRSRGRLDCRRWPAGPRPYGCSSRIPKTTSMTKSSMTTWSACCTPAAKELERSDGLLDSQTSVEFMREALLSDWSKITALAESLVAERRLSGAKALSSCSRARSTWGRVS